MKKVILVLLIQIPSLLSGQSINDLGKDWKSEGLQGKVKEASEMCYNLDDTTGTIDNLYYEFKIEFNEKGFETSSFQKNKKYQYTWQYNYNEANQLESYKVCNIKDGCKEAYIDRSDNEVHKFIYKNKDGTEKASLKVYYNSLGLPFKSYYNKKGKWNLALKLEYDSEENLIKGVYYDTDGKHNYTLTYSYSNEGKIVMQESPKRNIKYTKWTYDKYENLIKFEEFNKYKYLRSKRLFFYDANNKLIREEQYSEDFNKFPKYKGKSQSYIDKKLAKQDLPLKVWETTTYKYDKKGNWVLKSIFIDGKETSNCERTITYYE